MRQKECTVCTVIALEPLNSLIHGRNAALSTLCRSLIPCTFIFTVLIGVSSAHLDDLTNSKAECKGLVALCLVEHLVVALQSADVLDLHSLAALQYNCKCKGCNPATQVKAMQKTSNSITEAITCTHVPRLSDTQAGLISDLRSERY